MSFLFIGARLRVTGSGGVPLSGGKVFTYQSGTTIPKAAYNDAALTVPKGFPFILDVNGEADCWLDGTYKILIKDANDVTLPGYPVDYIPGSSVSVNELASASGAGMVGTTQGDTVQEALDSIIASAKKVTVRQTALSGPHNSDGTPNLGGGTGATIVTTSGIAPGANRLTVTAGGGFNNDGALDYIGYSDANLVFSGLSTNGTMYMYVDITPATGVLTVGTGTLAPVYGNGTPSVVNGQFTYSISEGIAYVGNGATATPSPRVYLGEVTVAGGVVTAISWYSFGTYPIQRDVAASRALNTTYTNSSARPIWLEVTVNVATGDSMTLLKNGTAVQAFGNTTASTMALSFSTMVQPGQTYRINSGGGYSFTWHETR